jgi:hypothetical protein
MDKDEKEELKKSKSKLNDVIILDTGSTIPATIANPDFITNLRSSKESLRMATNTGTKELNLKGEVLGFGDAWYDPEFIANIFSFLHMKDKYRITSDSKVDDAFHVQACDAASIFGRLALSIVEICRNCDNRVGDFGAEIVFSDFLQLPKDQRRDLFRRYDFVADLESAVVTLLGDVVRNELQFVLRLFETTTDKAL